MQHVKDLDLFAVSPVLSLYRSRNAKLSGKGLSPDSVALRDLIKTRSIHVCCGSILPLV